MRNVLNEITKLRRGREGGSSDSYGSKSYFIRHARCLYVGVTIYIFPYPMYTIKDLVFMAFYRISQFMPFEVG